MVLALVATLLLGQLVDHVAEEDRPVAARERVGVLEVLLELAVGVLVVVRVVAPAELVDVAGDRRQEVVVAAEPVEVVAGFLEGVEGIGELDRAVVVQLDEEVLELEPHAEVEALRAGLLDLAPENSARVVGPLFSVDVDVAGEACHRRLPGDRREAREVRDRRDVGVARELSDLAGGEAGEARSVGHEVVEICCRHELGARPRVHVHELREVEVDSALLRLLADVVDGGCGGGVRHAAYLPLSGSGEARLD